MRKQYKKVKITPIGTTLHKPFTKLIWEPNDEIYKDFILTIDTREQQALFRRPPKRLTIVRDTIPTGDYSIKGFFSEIAFERKSLPDLYTCLGKDRGRFTEELRRFRDIDHRFLVIEGTEHEVLTPQYYSQIAPASVRMALVSIELKYGLHIYYGTRKDIERYILDRLRKFYLYKRKGEL